MHYTTAKTGCILRLSAIAFQYLGDDAKCEPLRKALFPTSVRQNPDVIPQRASQSSPARSHFMHKGVAFRPHRPPPPPPPPGVKHEERNRAGRLCDVAKASAALYRDGERQPERKSTIRLSGVLTFAILFIPFFCFFTDPCVTDSMIAELMTSIQGGASRDVPEQS